YFQVDANGELTTPLLPNAGADAERYGIPPDERQARLELETSIRNVLSENRLVERPAPERLRRLTSSFDESELSACDAAAEAGSTAPAAAPPAAVFDELALSAARASAATTTAAEKNVAPLPRQYR